MDYCNSFSNEDKQNFLAFDIKQGLIEFNENAKKLKLNNENLKRNIEKIINEQEKLSFYKNKEKEYIIIYLERNNNKDIFLIEDIKKLEKIISQTSKFKILEKEVETILDAIHDDILIADRNGIITKVYPSFEKVYGIKKTEAEGKSVYELEKKGYFKPSITGKVLKKKSQITMMQETKDGRKLIATATPIKNEKNEITKVISFTRDVTDYLTLKKQYSLLENKVKKYSAEIEKLRNKNKKTPDIIGESEEIKKIINTIEKIACFDTNILIEGESGVGKTMFARMIHSKSKRSEGPLIEIDCGAIPDKLLESELFGYEKGAFTGASNEGKVGLIELSDKGTLFLDEIGELPVNLQMKLLKVIEEKKITHIGGTKQIDVDFRLITATNKNLKDLINKKRFREDLYYRLNIIYIEIPSLRERKKDIKELSNYFLQKYNKKYNLNKRFDEDVYYYLKKYRWPGNIRELSNIIERMVLVSSSEEICIDSLPNFRAQSPKQENCNDLKKALENYEEDLIKLAYEKYKSTVGVAKELSISQATASRKIKKYIEE